MFPIKRHILLRDIPDANRFGAQRRFDIHTGVDLFCDEHEPVYAVESGEITEVCYFTGPEVEMPWWNTTMAVAIEGNSGVVLYGEIEPVDSLVKGGKVTEGDLIGHVVKVLKKDKGKPRTMLHIEWYETGYRGNWDFWKEKEKIPVGLKNIEILIFSDGVCTNYPLI